MSFVRKTSLVLVSLAVGFLLVELGMRAIVGSGFSFSRNFIFENTELLRDRTVTAYHPQLGWRTQPVSVSQGSAITYGPHGVRMNGPDIDPLPTGAILAVGDSFTAGSEVSDIFSWPAQLEQIVRKPVVNASTGGWGSDQIILQTEMLLPVVKPSSVIVSFLDVSLARSEMSVFGGRAKPYYSIQAGELTRHNDPVPDSAVGIGKAGRIAKIAGHSLALTVALDRIGLLQPFQRRLTHRQEHKDGAAVTCRLLERLGKKLADDGIPAVALFQFGAINFLSDDKQPGGRARTVETCAARTGFRTVSLFTPLQQTFTNDRPAFDRLFNRIGNPNDPDGRRVIYAHMSAAGNGFVAETLARDAQDFLGRDALSPREIEARTNLVPPQEEPARFLSQTTGVEADIQVVPVSTPTESDRALLIRETQADTEHYIQGGPYWVGARQPMTLSAIIKPGAREKVRLQLRDKTTSNIVSVELADETAGSIHPEGQDHNPQIEGIGNGWRRVSMTAPVEGFIHYIVQPLANADGTSYVGNEKNSMWISALMIVPAGAERPYRRERCNPACNPVWAAWASNNPTGSQ